MNHTNRNAGYRSVRRALRGLWPLAFGGLVLLLLGTMPAAAQNDPVSFEAVSDARQVLLGSAFEVTFSLRNAEGENFSPPDFTDFDVIAGPSRSVRTSIINGRVTREMGFIYTLQPRRTGQLSIGQASIRVNGRTLRTNPLNVQVVEGSDLAGNQAYFVRAEISKERAFIGEQILLDYTLYTSVEIDGINVLEESDYDGFFAREIRQFDTRVIREVINGRQYVSRVLKRMVLYPQQSGKLTIAPYRLMLGVVLEGQEDRGFFFRRRLRQETVATNSITIDARSLPQPPPADFSGGTGTFQLSSELSRNDISTDDAVTLQVRIAGAGDLMRIQPPTLHVPEGLESYDPKVLTQEWNESSTDVGGVKVFEYILVPQQPGRYTIQPTFTYFNADSAGYATLRGDEYTLFVRPGSAVPPLTSEGEAIAETEEATTMRPFHPRVRLRQPGSALLGTTLFWTLAALPFLLLGLTFVYARYREHQAGIDPAEKRRQRARRVAEQHLRTAEQHLAAGNSRAFYDEVARAMLGYITDKLQIPRAELTKQNVYQRLLQLGTGEAQADRFVRVLQNCEIARYGGADNAAAMRETYEDAVGMLAEVEGGTRPA